jgi:hypothetical protein
MLDNPQCVDDNECLVMSNPEERQGSQTSDIKKINYSWVRKRINMAEGFKLAAYLLTVSAMQSLHHHQE